MDLSQKYTINTEKLSWRVIDDEVVILNLDSGNYYDLNAVGARIWNAITKKKSLGEIIEALKEEYQVDGKRLENDLKKILLDLEKEQLIKK
ncbi:MAG: PqqD family protein [Candidatus Omnitrophica bacterium]|nr:PqqD family protein [Candidatus Omnitrophota bacterium]